MSTTSSSRPAPLDIASLLADFDASGQSAAAFARSRGIRSWRLYHALNRRRGNVRGRKPQPAFVPVNVVGAAPVITSSSLELLLAGGHRLRIDADFDAALLRRVVEALASC
jgi:hypothetical protein